MVHIKGSISEKEFIFRCLTYAYVKREFANKWFAEHGYEHVSYYDIPIRIRVKCDKYLDTVMGTKEANNRIMEIRSLGPKSKCILEEIIYSEKLAKEKRKRVLLWRKKHPIQNLLRKLGLPIVEII